MSYVFKEYVLVVKNWNLGCKKGILVLMNFGKVIIYVMMGIEFCGMFLIDLGMEVYEGMIVGENSCENDIMVNIIKGKNLINVWVVGFDDMVWIKMLMYLFFEEFFEFLNDDEYCEIMLENVCLCK